MFSIEQTINDFIGFIKKYFTTIYNLLFHPEKVIIDVERKDTSRYVSPRVFFLITLFIYLGFRLEWKVSSSFILYESIPLLKNTFKRVFTFPDINDLASFFLCALGTYLIIRLIILLLKLKLWGKLFTSIALYWISLQLLTLFFHTLLFLLFGLFGFGFGSDVINVLYSNIYPFSFYVFLIFSPIILLTSLYTKYFKYNSSLFFKLSIVPILVFYSSSFYLATYDFLQDFLSEGEDAKKEFISIEDIDRNNVLIIHVVKKDSTYDLTSETIVYNHTNSDLVFDKNKCLVLNNDSALNDFCIDDCNCKENILFKLNEKHFVNDLILTIKSNERKALELKSACDSTLLSKYITSKDSSSVGKLTFKLIMPWKVRMYQLPEFYKARVKFTSEK